MNKTHNPKTVDIKSEWYFVDADNVGLGKLATKVAKILIGKDSATYTPGIPSKNHVVVTNASKIHVSGNKMEGKVYYRHSDYPGALKQETLKEVMEKYPTRAVERAVSGMLPKTKLRKRYMAKLHVYEGTEHPHTAQEGKE